MIKIIGSILIIISSTAFGMTAASKLTARVTELELIIKMIEEIKTRIQYNRSTVLELFDSMNHQGDYSSLYFLNDIVMFLKNNPINNNLLSFEFKNDKTFLSKKDQALLISSLKELGTMDIEGQLSSLTLYKIRFDEQLTLARQEQNKKGKLYRTLGILCGIGIAIVII